MFYLHLNHTGKLVPDLDGSQLADIEAAKHEARQSICEIAADCLRAQRKFTLWSIRICDREDHLTAEVFIPEAVSDVIPPRLLAFFAPDWHVRPEAWSASGGL
ncbi:DUF6894 family protein [Agrobacterium rosae]